MNHSLVLALDGGENAVQRGLHADHLTLHDLHAKEPRQTHEESKRIRGGRTRYWPSRRDRRLRGVVDGGMSVRSGIGWGWGRCEGKRGCGGTYSTLAVDKACTFFFSGFSKTHCAPLSWHRRQGACKEGGCNASSWPGRADGRADGTGKGEVRVSNRRQGGRGGVYGPRLRTCSCPCDSWCRPARPASGCGRQRRTRTHRGRRGNLVGRPSRTGGRRLQRR